MKKTILIFVVCLMAGTTTSYAQLSNDQKKESAEMLKALKGQLNEMTSKVLCKKTKKLEKEGWNNTSGGLQSRYSWASCI